MLRRPHATPGARSKSLDRPSTRILLCIAVMSVALSNMSFAYGGNFQVLRTFTPPAPKGYEPRGLTAVGTKLYGTTYYGGTNDKGTIYSMNLNGSNFTTLDSFGSLGGVWPNSPPAQVGSTLYGTTDNQNIYSMNLDGSNLNVVTQLPGVSSGVIQIGSSLYGNDIPSSTDDGYGWTFSMNLDGSNQQTLHTYTQSGSDGSRPDALTFSGSKLYGSADTGGSSGDGTVFSMNLNGSGYKTLHTFTGTDGNGPTANLVVGSTLYGTTSLGGNSTGAGTVFSMNLDGTNFRTLHAFTGGNDQQFPLTGLTLLGSKLYGTTFGISGSPTEVGTIFSINLDGSGFQTIYTFTGGSDGSSPTETLVASGTTLYGTNGEIAFSIIVPEPSAYVMAAFALVALLVVIRHNNRRVFARRMFG